jgi:hypothetical protein
MPLKNTAGGPHKVHAGGQVSRIKTMPLKITAGKPHKIHAAEEHSRRAAQSTCRQAGKQVD